MTQTTYRRELIHQAEQLAPEAMSAGPSAPGKHEGSSDPTLALALEVLAGHGLGDDHAGTVETGLYLARFGRYVFGEDGQGFVDVFTHLSDAEAQAALDRRAEEEGE